MAKRKLRKPCGRRYKPIAADVYGYDWRLSACHCGPITISRVNDSTTVLTGKLAIPTPIGEFGVEFSDTLHRHSGSPPSRSYSPPPSPSGFYSAAADATRVETGYHRDD